MSSPKKTSSAMSFEQASARLDAIVAEMEQPETRLETMIALVEEGLKLIRNSRAMLAEAELKIRKLEEQPDSDSQTHTAAHDDGFSLL